MSYMKSTSCGCKFYYSSEDAHYFHRLDGPAVVRSELCLNAGFPNDWWIDGKKIPVKTQEEFEKYMKLKAFH